MTAAEGSLSRRRRGLSLAADEPFAPVAVSLWGRGPPPPTLAPPQGKRRGSGSRQGITTCGRGLSQSRPRCSSFSSLHSRRSRPTAAPSPPLRRAGPGTPVLRSCSCRTAQPRLRHDRRHARRRPRTDAHHARPARRAGHRLHRRHLAPSPVLPGAGPAGHRPVRPEQRRAAQRRSVRRLPGPRPDPRDRARGSAGRATDRLRRQVPQRLHHPGRTAPPGGRTGTRCRGASTTTSTSR